MSVSLRKQRDKPSENRIFKKDKKMVTIYNTTLSATSQRHFSDSLGGGKSGYSHPIIFQKGLLL